MTHPPQRPIEPTARNVAQPGATARTPMQPKAEGGGPNPPTRGPRLTPRQAAAVRALLEGCTVPQAARRVGVIRQTVWRWLQRPDFAAELQRAHERLLMRTSLLRAEAGGPTAAPARLSGLAGRGPTPDKPDPEFERWAAGVLARVKSIGARMKHDLRSDEPEQSHRRATPCNLAHPGATGRNMKEVMNQSDSA